MTVGVLSRMTEVFSFKLPISVIPANYLSFPRKRESRKYLFLKQIKEKRAWIPNQVGNDIYPQSSLWFVSIFLFVRISSFDNTYINWPGFLIEDFRNDKKRAGMTESQFYE